MPCHFCWLDNSRLNLRRCHTGSYFPSAWEIASFELTIGGEQVPGAASGADIVRQGRRGVTTTTLLDLRGYRMKIRRTQYDEVDLDAVVGFANVLLQAMFAATPPAHP